MIRVPPIARLSLTAAHPRAAAGFDGLDTLADLPALSPRQRPAASVPPPTVAEASRAERRARLRHEVEQGLGTRPDPSPTLAGLCRATVARLRRETDREQEIDPTPSSRPDALADMGIGDIEATEEPETDADIDGALREVREEGGGFELSYDEENDARRGEW